MKPKSMKKSKTMKKSITIKKSDDIEVDSVEVDSVEVDTIFDKFPKSMRLRLMFYSKNFQNMCHQLVMRLRNIHRK